MIAADLKIVFFYLIIHNVALHNLRKKSIFFMQLVILMSPNWKKSNFKIRYLEKKSSLKNFNIELVDPTTFILLRPLVERTASACQNIKAE